MPLKNNRIVWTCELHTRFLCAVEALGLDASPSKLVYSMNVIGLNRYHVASHFQRYKKQLEKSKIVTSTSNKFAIKPDFQNIKFSVLTPPEALLSTMCGNIPTTNSLPFSGFCNVMFCMKL